MYFLYIFIFQDSLSNPSLTSLGVSHAPATLPGSPDSPWLTHHPQQRLAYPNINIKTENQGLLSCTEAQKDASSFKDNPWMSWPQRNDFRSCANFGGAGDDRLNISPPYPPPPVPPAPHRDMSSATSAFTDPALKSHTPPKSALDNAADLQRDLQQQQQKYCSPPLQLPTEPFKLGANPAAKTLNNNMDGKLYPDLMGKSAKGMDKEQTTQLGTSNSASGQKRVYVPAGE